MLDVKFIRENPKIVKKAYKDRGFTLDIDSLLRYDKEFCQLKQKTDSLKHKRNLISQEINRLKKERKPITEKIKEVKKIPDQIKILDKKIQELKEKINYLMLRVPNLPHNSVPIGETDKDNKTVRKYGKIPKFKFKIKDHEELGKNLDLIDIERAAKVSGARFYYLKNEAVLLEFALIKFVLDILIKEGFTLFIPPVLVRKKALYGTGFLPLGEEDLYKIENEDLALVGTSEVSLGALHMNEILNKKDLPLYYAGFSSCFRTEAGSHGKDTKGIFRTHQFDKVEMFKFTTQEDSWKEHEKLIKTAEKFVKALKLPYRLVNICTGELGAVVAKRYDIEVWLPAQGKYREIISCSNCTDYQARRLNIKYRDGNKIKYVHTLNSTALAIGRTLVALFENYQQKDGSIRIPTVLQPFLQGIKKIAKK